MLDQQQAQHVEDFETTETQYSTNIYDVAFMLASLMHHQVKDYHYHLYTFLSSYILIFICLAKQKMFSLLSLTLANFTFSAFFLALHPPAFQNFHNFLFSDLSLLTFSFHHHVCFLHMPFSVHPQVFSVPESKSCFNLNGKLSTCSPEVFSVSPVIVSQNFS